VVDGRDRRSHDRTCFVELNIPPSIVSSGEAVLELDPSRRQPPPSRDRRFRGAKPGAHDDGRVKRRNSSRTSASAEEPLLSYCFYDRLFPGTKKSAVTSVVSASEDDVKSATIREPER
jgi:hypothetical protein